MGTSPKLKLFKFSVLCGALLVTISPAYPAGVGVGPGVGGVGAPASTGSIGSSTAGTTTQGSALGTLGGARVGAQSSTTNGLGSMGLTGPGVTAGVSTSSQGLVGGLTPSDQSFITNFGTPTGSGSVVGSGGQTPAQQMEMNAQTNAHAALSDGPGAPLSSTTTSATGPSATVTGSNTTAPGVSTTAATGSAATSSTTSVAPIVNPPIPDNPGTLAETAQSGTP